MSIFTKTISFVITITTSSILILTARGKQQREIKMEGFGAKGSQKKLHQAKGTVVLTFFNL